MWAVIFTRYQWPCCGEATVCTASVRTFERKTTSGQFQVNSFNEMTDCNNNVVEQSVSRSLVPQLTRGQADSLCVIYEVFDCVSVFLGVGGGGQMVTQLLGSQWLVTLFYRCLSKSCMQVCGFVLLNISPTNRTTWDAYKCHMIFLIILTWGFWPVFDRSRNIAKCNILKSCI